MLCNKLEYLNVKGNKLSDQEALLYQNAMHNNSSIIKLEIGFKKRTPSEIVRKVRDEIVYN